MDNGSRVVSYTLAALAGVCFITGLSILTDGRGMADHGTTQTRSTHA